MAFQNVGTFDLGTVGGQAPQGGNARNFSMDAAGIASGQAFLTSELEKRDMMVRTPLTSFTYTRDIPIRVGGGWAEFVSAMQVGYGITGGSGDNLMHAGGSDGIPSIIYAAQTNPIFARKEQICESDIKFLFRICQTAGLNLKYTKNALIIYNPQEQEGEKSVRTFKKGETGILESRLYHQKDDADYAKCRVFYMDPVKKELIEYTYQRREDGRKIELQQKVSGTEEAALMAKNIMRGKNSKEYTGCLECGVDIALATGKMIALSGYGEHDRKYIITKSIQKINAGIHTTRIWFEMAMEGY